MKDIECKLKQKETQTMKNKIENHVHTQEARTLDLPFNKTRLFKLIQQTLFTINLHAS